MAAPSSEAAYASLQAYKPRTAEETLGAAEAKYDVGGARERVGNLRSLVGNLQSAVEAVDPSVTGRTSGTFTSEGQRQALVNRERQPILGDLSKQQGFLGEEQAALTQSQALASQMATALFNQDQQSYQRLLDQYNAATAAEQAAEQRRQFEEQQRLERERLAATERASRAASQTTLPPWSPTTPAQQAKQYVGNDDFRGRLAYLASQGDADAKIGLRYAGNDARYDGPVKDLAEFSALKRLGVRGNYNVPGLGWVGGNTGGAGIDLSKFSFGG